jgi:hypothetical protein
MHVTLDIDTGSPVHTVFLIRSSGPNFWDRTNTGAVVESTLRPRSPTFKDVRRATSPLNARVPVNTADGVYGNWTCPRVLSETACRGDDRQTFPYWNNPRCHV